MTKSMTLDELRALRLAAEQKAKKRGHRDIEGVEQQHLLMFMKTHRDPVVREMYDVIYHVPNGGSRHAAEAKKLKAQGVRAGVSDLVVPMARGGYFGLYLELKAAPPNTSALAESQQEWLLKMNRNGYAAVLAIGLAEMKAVIESYASMPCTVSKQREQLGALRSVGGADWYTMKTTKPRARKSSLKK